MFIDILQQAQTARSTATDNIQESQSFSHHIVISAIILISQKILQKEPIVDMMKSSTTFRNVHRLVSRHYDFRTTAAGIWAPVPWWPLRLARIQLCVLWYLGTKDDHLLDIATGRRLKIETEVLTIPRLDSYVLELDVKLHQPNLQGRWTRTKLQKSTKNVHRCANSRAKKWFVYI